MADSSTGNQEGFHREVTFELGFESFPFGEGRNESIRTCMLKDMELWKVLEFSGEHKRQNSSAGMALAFWGGGRGGAGGSAVARQELETG